MDLQMKGLEQLYVGTVSEFDAHPKKLINLESNFLLETTEGKKLIITIITSISAHNNNTEGV